MIHVNDLRGAAMAQPLLAATAWVGHGPVVATPIRHKPLFLKERMDVRVLSGSTVGLDDEELIGGSYSAGLPPEETDELLLGDPLAFDASVPTPRPTPEMWLRRRYWVPKPGERLGPQLPGEHIKVTGLSLTKIKERKAAQLRGNTAALRARLSGIGVPKAATTRMVQQPWMRAALQPVPWWNGSCVAVRQFDSLQEVLMHNRSVKAVLLRHAQLILTRDMDLGARIQALSNATGLSPLQVAMSQPGLLSLEHSRINARLRALQAELGGVELQPLLLRAPRLISRSPEHVRIALADLDALTAPTGLSARQLVQAQPSLLMCRSASESVAPKLDRLRQLTTEAEWAQLVGKGGGTLPRLLTCSIGRMDRLQRVPKPLPEGRARSVASILVMSERKFEQWLEKRQAG
jgi:hypothetical protein